MTSLFTRTFQIFCLDFLWTFHIFSHFFCIEEMEKNVLEKIQKSYPNKYPDFLTASATIGPKCLFLLKIKDSQKLLIRKTRVHTYLYVVPKVSEPDDHSSFCFSTMIVTKVLLFLLGSRKCTSLIGIVICFHLILILPNTILSKSTHSTSGNGK